MIVYSNINRWTHHTRSYPNKHMALVCPKRYQCDFKTHTVFANQAGLNVQSNVSVPQYQTGKLKLNGWEGSSNATRLLLGFSPAAAAGAGATFTLLTNLVGLLWVLWAMSEAGALLGHLGFSCAHVANNSKICFCTIVMRSDLLLIKRKCTGRMKYSQRNLCSLWRYIRKLLWHYSVLHILYLYIHISPIYPKHATFRSITTVKLRKNVFNAFIACIHL